MRRNYLKSMMIVAVWLGAAFAGTPDTWVPVRWDGGPLELARRAKDEAPADAAAREAIAQWYKPETLALLDGVPVNCLLLSLSAGAAPEIEREQQALVKNYAAAARQRGLAVLGLVYPGADAARAAAAAVEARLDGVVLEGEFQADFEAQMEKALAAAGSTALVIPIARQLASVRLAKSPVIAVEGTSPSARNLADEGIRGGVSTEPWIESNIWEVHSLRLKPGPRAVWVSLQPAGGTAFDYIDAVADSAVAGGRWIVSLDDSLRAKLLRQDAEAMGVWRSIGGYLKFAEEHAEWWRAFEPYGNVGVILDTVSADPDNSDEYLHLMMRRHLPYRVIVRSELTAESLAGLRAVVAADVITPTDAERKLFSAFAAQGGLVMIGPAWGNPPPQMPYVEQPLGKGRVVVYKDSPPEPDSVGRDLKDLLNPPDLGVSVFNVPTSIMYAGTAGSGKRVLVQLLNYSKFPATVITVRVNGEFKTARLFTPEGPAVDLTIHKAGDRSEIALPKLAVWGAILLE